MLGGQPFQSLLLAIRARKYGQNGVLPSVHLPQPGLQGALVVGAVNAPVLLDPQVLKVR
jgi:hypothetical protein